MNKYEELYQGIKEILEWAEDQEHITEEALEILQENLEKFKIKLDKESEIG